MINRSEVGSRISVMRKEAGYTQAVFADKLGVSTQAVSKWENGAALPDVEILLGISWLFKISINEILVGNNVFTKIVNRPFDFNGIAFFEADEESADGYKVPSDVDWAKRMVQEKWIKRNWDSSMARKTYRMDLAKRVVEHGGLILEIGAGPGGFMVDILREDFNANIIISDISPTCVREWKKLFDNEIQPPNIHYAVLDNCDLPFEDNSIDVISAGGGFGNTVGDKFKCLTEIYRVLKPGGMYVVGDGFITKEMLKTLPENVQKILLVKRQDVFEDYYEATVTAGFKKIDNPLFGSWSTKGDESDIADLANELGVELIFTSYLRYCIK